MPRPLAVMTATWSVTRNRSRIMRSNVVGHPVAAPGAFRRGRDPRCRCRPRPRAAVFPIRATRLAQPTWSSRIGKGFGRTSALTLSGRLRSPPVCPTLKTRSGRARPTMDVPQRHSATKREPNPLRKARCTNIHTIHPGKPLRRSPRTLTIALKRPMDAALPRSRYLKGTLSPPLSRRLIVLAACRPPCMATSHTPGSLSRDAMSPTAKTSGCPGRLRSGSTAILPARSVSAPVASASRPAKGEAWTPAAQMTVPHSKRPVAPSALSVSTPNGSTPTTRRPMRSSTPIFSSSVLARSESCPPNVASGSWPPSTRTTRTAPGSMLRNSPARLR